jgi:thiosulfate reductase cytochrome b subunit
MRYFRLSIVLVLAGVLLLVAGITMAQDDTEAPIPTSDTVISSSLHPQFALLDAEGISVLESGQALSTGKTCGQCHDTAFIAEHSQHSQVVVNTLEDWNPILYRYISEDSQSDLDLNTWFREFGSRYVGGGADSPFEMDCFLCHTPAPNTQARNEALESGDFVWSNSVTLLDTGILSANEDGWVWNAAAFDTDGLLKSELISIQDPTNQNCGQCHGVVQTSSQVPLTTPTCDASEWRTFTSGQIVSPQRMANSALNLAGKEDLSRSWDVHAERMVNCVDCHYALNNPTYYKQVSEDHPDHLIFDPRRLDISEYLYRPLHDLANGDVLSEAGKLVHNDPSQPCEACHSLEDNHTWLPYKARHLDVLACEGCHVPTLNAPALQTVDWTVLQADATPNLTCRGEDEGLITGYEPVLSTNDQGLLAPQNLVGAWYWVSGEDKQPVPYEFLKAAWLDESGYRTDVLAIFDENQNGSLDDVELLIDTPEKEQLIQAGLEAQGLSNVHIAAEVESFNIKHGIAYGEWATKDCDSCHTDDSRINQAFLLTSTMPGGVLPTNDGGGLNGEWVTDDDGALFFQPHNTDLYVLGHDRVSWVDWLGIIMFLGTFAGVILHGGLRYASVRVEIPHDADMKRVYMYSVYERQWHWLQTVVIFMLIFTGLIIHKPALFGAFSFRYVVLVHNVSAAILVINAALAAFYHLASGEIRQFLPRPYGFFDQAFQQAVFYLRGIFKGDPHPFEKTIDHKLNPLQQVTYLVLLNILLPLQILTGALMWGQQHFPEIAERLGGLPYLAPAHTLIAWSLASFIVMHVYLTTTSHQPLTNIKAMLLGWDEVETLEQEKGLPL